MAVTKPIASGTIVLGTPPEPGDNTAKVATMEAVQDLVTERISSAFIYQGSTDCSANPNYPAASAGHLYRVSVAGKIGGASGVPVGAGDFFVALEDNVGGTEAAVGTSWEVWEGNLQPGVDYNSYRAEVDKLNVQAVALASAATVDIGAASGDYVSITGNTTITGFGTAEAGVARVLVFASTPTLTHNATSLILPTGANITCAAGDVAVMRSLGSGNWRCIDFVRASGEALTVSATSVGAAVHGATGKTTPVDADTVPLIDSAASNVLKKLTWANLKATLKTYFDTLYAAVSHTHALSSLTQSSATTGQVPTWNGSAWAAATPSGGGAAISTPKLAYVETDGNNGTAVIGDPSKPFATAQAANDAIAAAAAGDYGLRLGIGSHGGITGITSKIKSITGRGASLSFLGGITNPGATVEIVGDMSCNLGDITTLGANGAGGADGGEGMGGDGSPGQDGGTIRLRNCVFVNANANGGDGGSGGPGSPGGAQGAGGNSGLIELLGCRFYDAQSLAGAGVGGMPTQASCVIAQCACYNVTAAGKMLLTLYSYQTGLTETGSVNDSTLTLP